MAGSWNYQPAVTVVQFDDVVSAYLDETTLLRPSRPIPLPDQQEQECDCDGDGECVIGAEELDGFQIFDVGSHIITGATTRSYKAIGCRRREPAALDECPIPTCYGTIDKSGTCTECGHVVIGGTAVESDAVVAFDE